MAKTFKDSPAMAFFSPPAKEPEGDSQLADAAPAQAPVQTHALAQAHAFGQAQAHTQAQVQQAQKERRTQRLPLMLTPSMYQKMCLRAGREDISLGELGRRAIQKYLQDE